MEYTRMINQKLKQNQLNAIHHYPQPLMFGGIRFLSGHPDAGGNEFKDPSTLYTAGFPEYNISGGSVNFKKIGKTLSKLGKNTGNQILKTIPSIASDSIKNSIVPALSKYGEKALTNYLAPAVESAVMDAGPAMAGMGMKRRGRGRPKKKSDDGIHIDINSHNAKRDIEGGSFKSVMKKVGKVGKQVFNKALPMAEKYAANALMDYALPAAETGAEFVAANPEVLLLAAGRKARKGRFPKGSQAAKDHMAKIRAMRK